MARLWQNGFVSLAIALAAAVALSAAPRDFRQRFESALLDTVRPGGMLVTWVQHEAAMATDSLRETARDWVQARLDSRKVDASRLRAQRDAAIAAQHRLEAELAALRMQQRTARNDLGENVSLIDTEPLLRMAHVAARVIGRDPQSVDRLADRLIAAGEADGVAAGELVIDAALVEDRASSDLLLDVGRADALDSDMTVTAAGVLVGRIRRSGRWTSVVQSVRDPEFRVGARIVRSTRDGPVMGSPGVFVGGKDRGRLELVPATAPVQPGDHVYTHEQVAGMDTLLFIGEVSRAETVTGEPHWRIEVTPALSDAFNRVEVLRPEVNPARVTAQSATSVPAGAGTVR